MQWERSCRRWASKRNPGGCTGWNSGHGSVQGAVGGIWWSCRALTMAWWWEVANILWKFYSSTGYLFTRKNWKWNNQFFMVWISGSRTGGWELFAWASCPRSHGRFSPSACRDSCRKAWLVSQFPGPPKNNISCVEASLPLIALETCHCEMPWSSLRASCEMYLLLFLLRKLFNLWIQPQSPWRKVI